MATDSNALSESALQGHTPGSLADIVVQLSAIQTVLREAHFALDDSEDWSHLDDPVHAVPLDNVTRLHRALKVCERFAGEGEGWDGPGPLVARIIEQLGYHLNRTAALQVALEDICDPIAAMRRYASEQGRQLEGAVAFQLANDPNHLKSIARAAIAKALGK